MNLPVTSDAWSSKGPDSVTSTTGWTGTIQVCRGSRRRCGAPFPWIASIFEAGSGSSLVSIRS
jgi:hypothetical protein